MNTTALLGVAVLSAATAALVTALLLPASARAGPQVAESPQNFATARAHAALVARVDDLRRKLEGERLILAGAPVRESAVETEVVAEPRLGNPATLATLTTRVAALERELARLRERDPSWAEEREPEVPVLDLQVQTLDPALTDEERLELLRELRWRKDDLGQDARSPEVVAQMIAMAEATADADLRADVWRQLDGSTVPALRDPLLRSLQYDPSENVRSEAAESLAAFRSDPVVENALRHAAANDSSEEVREEAQSSLER